jgi:nucleotide-binding universal stress UspA family protein
MGSGPIVIGFDGSPASEHAVREAAALLGSRPALVVVVWEAGAAYEMMDLPAVAGLPPAPLDLRAAVEVDQAMQERAQQLAQHGAALARQAGFEAEGLAVADEVTVAETLVRLARERDAQAVVVGAHGHGVLTERLIGTTSQSVVRHAACPVVVVPPSGAER